MIHGLNPGFELFIRNIDILTILFSGLIIANFMLLIGVISTYAIRSQVFDLFATIVK